ARAAAEADLLFQDERGIEHPDVRVEVERTMNELEASEYVAEIDSPYENPGFISQDGTIARAVIRFAGDQDDIGVPEVEEILEIVDAAAARDHDVTIEVGGDAIYFNE